MSHSLYVHIPLCIQKCTYCDFFSDPQYLERSDQIVDTLAREIAHRAHAEAVAAWDTVYVGGGTPSLLAPAQIDRLSRAILRTAPLAAGAEWTVEGNPEDITAEWLAACSDSGINRLSLGIQSMNDSELAAVGRRGDSRSNRAALELAKRTWRGRLSLDFISGLPGQTAESLGDSLSEATRFGADHVSLYALTLEEGTPLNLAASRGRVKDLPEGDDADGLWLLGRESLETAGFAQYEVSNFARPGNESRHNLVYWRLGDWLGAGPAASGTIRKGAGAVRTTGRGSVADWLADPVGSAMTETLSAAECGRETLLMGMRLLEGLSRPAFELRFGRDILELIGKTCARWRDLGLLDVSEDRIALGVDGLARLNGFLRDCMEEMG